MFIDSSANHPTQAAAKPYEQQQKIRDAADARRAGSKFRSSIFANNHKMLAIFFLRL